MTNNAFSNRYETAAGFGRVLAILVCLIIGPRIALAQPHIHVPSDIVSPGAVVSVTLAGTPGHHFALIGSSVGAGMSYGGLRLGVGADFMFLAQGVFDGTGQFTLGVTPAFVGTTLDRYYIQLATSSSPDFLPLTLSPGRVLRNADLVGNITAPVGSVGPVGPAGAIGATGPEGPIGPQGLPGAQGPEGPAGAAGVAGPAGPQGLTGPQGPEGSAGAAGPEGPVGPQGLTGPRGPEGAVGAAGAEGPAGQQGLTGPQGPEGPAGTAGPEGPVGPQGLTGLQGPEGPAGAAGAEGPAGPQGLTGPQGPEGREGPAGATGPQGHAGPAGTAGVQGPKGDPGSIASVVVRVGTANSVQSHTVMCRAGEVAFGGGGSANITAGNQSILGMLPVTGITAATAVTTPDGAVPNGWRVTTNFSGTITVHVICSY